MKPTALSVLLMLALAACGDDEPSFPPLGSENACGAKDFQGLLGQTEASLASARFEGPVRVIHPGQPITRDLRPDRLNIDIDDYGIIVRVFCG